MAPSALAYASAGWGNVTCTTALHVYLSHGALPMRIGPWLEGIGSPPQALTRRVRSMRERIPIDNGDRAISKRDLSPLVQRAPPPG